MEQALQTSATANAAPAPRYVGFWLRVVAFCLDLILLLIVMVPVAFMMYGGALLQGGAGFGFVNFMLNWVLPPVAIILFWRYRGATPGKMAVGAVIVDADHGGAPTLTQLIIRYFAYIPSSLVFGLGFLWIAWDARKQAWHDKLSRTVVIKRHGR